MSDRLTVGVCGLGRLSKGAVIPAFLETSECRVLAVTTQELHGVVKFELNDMPSDSYKAICVESEKTLEELYRKMEEQGYRVAIVCKDSALYKEMCREVRYWISACREGIFDYCRDIEEHCTEEPVYVYSMDNDKTLLERAKAMQRNKSLNLVQCTIHSVCKAAAFDETENVFKVTGGKERILYFPPEGIALKRSANIQVRFDTVTEYHFSESQEEYAFYQLGKLIMNAQHTLMCVLAYNHGNAHGFTMNEIAALKFIDLLRLDEMLKVARQADVEMFGALLEKNAATYGYSVIVHLAAIEEFVAGIYTDVVGRGLNPNDDTFQSKLERHFPLYVNIKDGQIQQHIMNFLTMCVISP